jgi:hypothetical protein
MVRSLLLAATALSLSSAIALAQNAPMGNDGVRAPVKMRHVAHHQKAMTAKPIYDYAPASANSYGNMPIFYGVAF